LQARHALLLLLAIAGAIPYGCHAVLSLALGGGIQVLNLAVLERSVRPVLAGQASGLVTAALFARLLLVLLGVSFALTFDGVARVPFLLGLSALVPAAAWYGLDKAAEQRTP
jgi:ATP synthase I chain